MSTDRFFVYRNLTRRGKVFSLKSETTKRVTEWVNVEVEALVLKNVNFKVSQKGRERVIRERKKYVHAGIVGSKIFQSELFDYTLFGTEAYRKTKVYYNPYKTETFVDESGTPIHSAKFVLITDKEVTAYV